MLYPPLPASHIHRNRPWVCASLGLPDVIQGPKPRPSWHQRSPLEHPQGQDPKMLLSHSCSQFSREEVETGSPTLLTAWTENRVKGGEKVGEAREGQDSHLSLFSALRREEGSWWWWQRPRPPPQHKPQGLHLRGRDGAAGAKLRLSVPLLWPLQYHHRHQGSQFLWQV